MEINQEPAESKQHTNSNQAGENDKNTNPVDFENEPLTTVKSEYEDSKHVQANNEEDEAEDEPVVLRT